MAREYRKAKKEFMYSIIVGNYYAFNVYKVTDAANQIYFVGSPQGHGGTTAIDFGTQTNQFSSMFQGCTQNIDVYAPAANQATIEAMAGYPNFGGTGTVTWHWRS